MDRQGTRRPCCDMSFKTIKDAVACVALPLTHAAAICSDTLLIRSLKARKGATTTLIVVYLILGFLFLFSSIFFKQITQVMFTISVFSILKWPHHLRIPHMLVYYSQFVYQLIPDFCESDWEELLRSAQAVVGLIQFVSLRIFRKLLWIVNNTIK